MVETLTLKEILNANPHISMEDIKRVREQLALLKKDSPKPGYGLASPFSRRRVKIGERHGRSTRRTR